MSKMKTLIKNGKIVLPDCSGFIDTDILIEDKKIIALGDNLTAENILDVDGKYLFGTDEILRASLSRAKEQTGHRRIGTDAGRDKDPHRSRIGRTDLVELGLPHGEPQPQQQHGGRQARHNPPPRPKRRPARSVHMSICAHGGYGVLISVSSPETG